jgi:hypothetical protein
LLGRHGVSPSNAQQAPLVSASIVLTKVGAHAQRTFIVLGEDVGRTTPASVSQDYRIAFHTQGSTANRNLHLSVSRGRIFFSLEQRSGHRTALSSYDCGNAIHSGELAVAAGPVRRRFSPVGSTRMPTPLDRATTVQLFALRPHQDHAPQPRAKQCGQNTGAPDPRAVSLGISDQRLCGR